MQYFISAEKTPYHYWQLELLIESLKKFNLIENTLIALADSEECGNRVPKNIAKCNVMLHDNWGAKLNYKYINKFLSLDLARKTSRIKPPFTILEPDMLMCKPIDFKFKEIDVYTGLMDSNTLENYKSTSLKYEVKEDKWQNIGSCISIGRDCPIMYQDMSKYCKDIIEFLAIKNTADKYWRLVDKISVVLALMKYNIRFKSLNELESGLFSNLKTYFIHYNDPYELFSKFDFQKGEKDTMNLEAYQKLMTINPEYSDNIKIMQENIKSYLKN